MREPRFWRRGGNPSPACLLAPAGARARAFAEAERAGILERILDALAPVTEPNRTDHA